jgi:hypothetical protein
MFSPQWQTNTPILDIETPKTSCHRGHREHRGKNKTYLFNREIQDKTDKLAF